MCCVGRVGVALTGFGGYEPGQPGPPGAAELPRLTRIVQLGRAADSPGGRWPGDGRIIGIVTAGDQDLSGVRSVRRAVLDAGMVPLVSGRRETGVQAIGPGADGLVVPECFGDQQQDPGVDPGGHGHVVVDVPNPGTLRAVAAMRWCTTARCA